MIQAIGSSSRPKISCTCIKPKIQKEVDQLWPKTEGPVTLKDSDILDVPTATPKKKTCECGISKKLKETESQQHKLENQPVGPTGKKVCKCGARDEGKTVKLQPTEIEESKGDEVNQLWPKSSERFKMSHQVTASKSKDLLKSATSIKCLKVKENFPFDIDTQVDVLNKPPEGVHVTTTITDSGTLEVITEGPEGVIETTLIYTNSGNVEVVTEILEYQGGKKGKSAKLGKSKHQAIEGPQTAVAAIEDLQTTAPKTEGATSGVKKPESGTAATAGISPDCRCTDCPVLIFNPDIAGSQINTKGIHTLYYK